MHKRATTLLMLGIFTATVARSDDSKDKKPTPKVKIGKDTTYVDGPLDKDGYIDYETALNKRLSERVKPESNANVLLMKALGPKPDGTEMPADFYKWLGIDAPSNKGDYLLGVNTFIKDHPNIDREEWNAILEQQLWAGVRPWTGKDYPHIAGWLKLNDKPLALVVEATRRKHYFHPLLSRRPEKGPSSLMYALLPTVQKCRELAIALKARSMLHVAEGKYDEAWRDLLACHRLARLVARGGTLMEALIGIAIEAIISNTDLAFLENPKLTAKQVQACLKDLQELPPMPSMADRIDLGERILFLDGVQFLRRDGAMTLQGVLPNFLSDFDPKMWEALKFIDSTPGLRQALDSVDWVPALRNANRWYDRLAASLRVKDRADREKQLEKIEEDRKALKKDAADLQKFAKLLLEKDPPDKSVSEAVGNVLVGLLMPDGHKVQRAVDRAEQSQRNLHVAFALAAYHRDHGRFPEKLGALAPKYLAVIPDDLFSGKALIYRPDEKGYLLYSVGVNGLDEGGRWYNNTPSGDDPHVRMPLPKLQPK